MIPDSATGAGYAALSVLTRYSNRTEKKQSLSVLRIAWNAGPAR